ncbi:MAG: DinB family protein [Candidatus Sulfotelmatobacter sp.]
MDFGKQYILDATRGSAWANQNLLEGCSALSDEELERDLRISHVNILGTLRHICDGERVWLDCLLTTGDGGTWRLPQSPAPKLSLDRLRQEWPEIWNGFSHWLETKSEAELQNEVILQLPGDVEERFPRWKILRHVLAHSNLHRGQVIGMIRMLGHQPPAVSPMDYYLSNMNILPRS